jgi:hypothetical protein
MDVEAVRNAVAARKQRAVAALWLEGMAFRAGLVWSELDQVPFWALIDTTSREALALHVGAWLHAGVLRGCVDGQIHRALRDEIGPESLAALMAEAVPDAATALSVDWKRWLLLEGRACMLAGIASPWLRLGLKAQFWPDDPSASGQLPAASAAAALVRRAAAYREPPLAGDKEGSAWAL